MRRFVFKPLAVLAVVLCIGEQDAQAASLAPGDSILMTGTTAALSPELTGVVIQDSILTTNTVQVPPDLSPFSVARFEVQNRVVRSDTDGTLIFAPRILFGFNTSSFDLHVTRVEMFGFGSFDIDAAYRTDGLGDRGPTSGSRSADGQLLSFSFGDPLFIGNIVQEPQEESHFFSLKTEATVFENTGRLSIFAEAVDDPVPGREYRFDVGGLAVPTVVPLPASLPLLASVLIAAFGVVRVRARAT